MGHVYAGTYESHPVAIKKHKMDGSMMDQKALLEFEIEVGPLISDRRTSRDHRSQSSVGRLVMQSGCTAAIDRKADRRAVHPLWVYLGCHRSWAVLESQHLFSSVCALENPVLGFWGWGHRIPMSLWVGFQDGH